MGWGTVLLANLQNSVTKKFPNVQVPMRDFNQLFRFKVMNSILSGSNDLMNLLNDNDLWAIGGVDLENKGTYIKMRLAKRARIKNSLLILMDSVRR